MEKMDYAKIAQNARKQQKTAKKQTIQEFIQEVMPGICSKAIQDAERIAQAGETHFALNLYKLTDGFDKQYRGKASHILYKATQKELSQYGLYLIGGNVYFRRCTYFIPRFFITVLNLLTMSCFICLMYTDSLRSDPWTFMGMCGLFALSVIADIWMLDQEGCY